MRYLVRSLGEGVNRINSRYSTFTIILQFLPLYLFEISVIYPDKLEDLIVPYYEWGIKMGDFLLKSGEKIVLIGDSITDCGRRAEFSPLGNGYVHIAANLASAKYPEREIMWVNKGISGDTVQGLVERWTEDVIKEDPDWVSIYIGINNVVRAPSLKDFEKSYREIVSRTLNETDAKIIMFEIFYVPSEVGP
jgi:hypothetical protein